MLSIKNEHTPRRASFPCSSAPIPHKLCPTDICKSSIRLLWVSQLLCFDYIVQFCLFSLSPRLKKDQMHVRDEISKVMERERAASNEHLARAILRERVATEDQRLKAQLLVSFPRWPRNEQMLLKIWEGASGLGRISESLSKYLPCSLA